MLRRIFACLLGAFALLAGIGDVQADAWHAYVKDGARTARAKAEIASLMRSGDPKFLRVRPETIMAQVANELGRGNWESPAAFAEWLMGDHVTEVACKPEDLRGLRLARTNASGTRFDFNWRRDKCDPGEKFLVYNGQIFLSTSCLNVVPSSEPRKAVAVPAECIDFTFRVHFWNFRKIRQDLLAKVSDLSRKEQEFKTPAVSRTFGGALRQCEMAGQCGRVSGASAHFRLIEQSGSVYREIGPVAAEASGVGEFKIPIQEARSKIVSGIFPANAISPPVGDNGSPELRAFPNEYKTACGVNLHAVLK